jgi:hypothetical protein
VPPDPGQCWSRGRARDHGVSVAQSHPHGKLLSSAPHGTKHMGPCPVIWKPSGDRVTVVRSRLAARQGCSRCAGCARSRFRHTAASLWLAAAAAPTVVQRVLRHATAAMTMDLYGHLVDASL